MDYASDVEILGKTDFMQEIFSPSFIVLASCVAVATLIVILLIGLICNKMCSRYVYGVEKYHQKQREFRVTQESAKKCKGQEIS